MQNYTPLHASFPTHLPKDSQTSPDIFCTVCIFSLVDTNRSVYSAEKDIDIHFFHWMGILYLLSPHWCWPDGRYILCCSIGWIWSTMLYQCHSWFQKKFHIIHRGRHCTLCFIVVDPTISILYIQLTFLSQKSSRPWRLQFLSIHALSAHVLLLKTLLF